MQTSSESQRVNVAVPHLHSHQGPEHNHASPTARYAAAETLHREGLNHQEAGKLEEARAAYEQALILVPEAAVTRSNLGNVLRAQGKLIDAIAAHHAALNYDPGYARGWTNLAATLEDAGELDAALGAARQAATIAPNDPEVRHILGNLELESGRPELAIENFVMALQADPRHGRALLNLAVALKEAGAMEAGTNALETLIALDPDNADAHFNLALNLLSAGKWRDGFAAYEWRLRIAGLRPRLPATPRWSGSSQPEATLLLLAEQGLGDTFQFLRFVETARQHVKRVIVAVQPALVPLLKNSGGVDETISLNDAIPPHDAHLPLMSLPLALDIANDAELAAPAWINPDAERERYWNQWLTNMFTAKALRIGIGWRGNPNYRKDASRSLDLEHFSALAAVPGISLISLQKGPGENEAFSAAFPLTIPPALDENAAFIDTAALVHSLDLVVTSDSALAHLCGAMAKPTWLLLSHRPDWRWGTEGDRTAWYPSATLFRQAQPGNWREVFERVAHSASIFAASRR